jgi:hypothetical protein
MRSRWPIALLVVLPLGCGLNPKGELPSANEERNAVPSSGDDDPLVEPDPDGANDPQDDVGNPAPVVALDDDAAGSEPFPEQQTPEPADVAIDDDSGEPMGADDDSAGPTGAEMDDPPGQGDPDGGDGDAGPPDGGNASPGDTRPAEDAGATDSGSDSGGLGGWVTEG